MTEGKVIKESSRIIFIKKYIGILFISGILIFFIILAIFNINFGQWLANMAVWFYREFGDFGLYFGVLLISIFGNFTIIFPVPYPIALIVISAVVPDVNPIIIGVMGGFGASIGEFTALLIGRGSKEIIGDSKRIEHMKQYVEKGWAPLLIFFFAATPLPDDAFLIVLGLANYSIFKALAYCFIGKFVLCFFSSALPIWLADTSIGKFLFNLFGIDLDAAMMGIIPDNTPLEVLQNSLIWAVSIIILFSLVYFDWNKIIKKLKEKVKSESYLS